MGKQEQEDEPSKSHSETWAIRVEDYINTKYFTTHSVIEAKKDALELASVNLVEARVGIFNEPNELTAREWDQAIFKALKKSDWEPLVLLIQEEARGFKETATQDDIEWEDLSKPYLNLASSICS